MSLQTVITTSQGLLTPVIAIVTVYIAYQQYKTNKRREQRECRSAKINVYKRVRIFLTYFKIHASIPTEKYEDFSETIAEADFLFPRSVVEWLASLHFRVSVLYQLKEDARQFVWAQVWDDATLYKVKQQYSDKEMWDRIDNDIIKVAEAYDELKETFSQHMK